MYINLDERLRSTGVQHQISKEITCALKHQANYKYRLLNSIIH